jgi:hypothetical protein
LEFENKLLKQQLEKERELNKDLWRSVKELQEFRENIIYTQNKSKDSKLNVLSVREAQYVIDQANEIKSLTEQLLEKERELFKWYWEHSYENHCDSDIETEVAEKFVEIERHLTQNQSNES